MIYIVLLYLLFLWTCSDLNKGWLLFWGILSVVAESRPINIVTLGILIGLAKVVSDLWAAVKK